MSLRLEIVSRQRQSLRERSSKEFGPDGGTIGRSLESDWSLPDAQRFMSSRHASIDFRSGSYYIVDTSTNGVFVNGSDSPVGRGKPQRLFSGDRLRIGDYEMMVEIDDLDDAAETMVNDDHVDPVDAADRVAAPEPTAADLVDAFEITGVGIQAQFEDDESSTLSPLAYKFETGELELEEESAPEPPPPPRPKPKSEKRVIRRAKSTSKPASKSKSRASSKSASPPPSRSAAKSKTRSKTRSTPKPVSKSKQSTKTPAETSGNSTAAVDTFLKGAGLDPRSLSPAEADVFLERLGKVMREMLAGVTESLQVRSLQKARMRQSNTTIQPKENNALKCSAGPEEAFENILFRSSDQYLGPVESIQGAFEDINTHQRATVDALQRALADYVSRFDPDKLEEKLANGKKGALMGATSKLKYWDIYRDVYLVLSQHAQGEFPHAFVEDFENAYEKEIASQSADNDKDKSKLKVG